MNWYVAATDGPEVDRLLSAWPEAPIEQGEVLEMILDAARDQVLAYAPALEPTVQEDGYLTTESIPSRYVLAQLRQAQTLWNAGQVSTAGDIGDGSFVFTPRPMDKTIRGIIRPPRFDAHVL